MLCWLYFAGYFTFSFHFTGCNIKIHHLAYWRLKFKLYTKPVLKQIWGPSTLQCRVFLKVYMHSAWNVMIGYVTGFQIKKKHCFHSNLVYAKVLKIRTGRLFLTRAFSPTLPELLSHTGSLEVTTCYFLELYSSNLNNKLCACYGSSKIYTWNFNCTINRKI